ncbi:CRISPR-associated endonuclease Cas2 [Streptomyces calidiresistens]|uniref:CRISPR-associated endoribonuclease Cas2 n=2 Tax=Streptomyces TaxID=1883 RepID=A0A7W3TAG3_9ACTN|nr:MULTISPECIES: CRISPR-associated endonuclease Cas2 [Streptomyces]MBB0228367.1 CRISPR-associated endonuclease Cas2 [Streptomyces calidiresistens]MBB0243224.1 CRISPR-associated endonuclease Cas2 [Streptomyces alkaliphilus]
MHVVVVYDTDAKRNARILRTCRKYLHHVQRSVFEGQLSDAQLRRFRAEVESVLDLSYDNVLVYTFPPGTTPVRMEWGAVQAMPTDVL